MKSKSTSNYQGLVPAYFYEYAYGDNASEDDIAFYREKLHGVRGNVLELACGTGRITIPLAESGIEIIGLDSSADMLRIARNKVDGRNLDIRFLHDDFHEFEIATKFDAIILALTSIWYVSNKRIDMFIDNVKNQMTAKGRFLFDHVQPLSWTEGPEMEIVEDWSEAIEVRELSRFVRRRVSISKPENRTQTCRYLWEISDHSGYTDRYETSMTMSTFTTEDYIELFEGKGFEVLERTKNGSKNRSYIEFIKK